MDFAESCLKLCSEKALLGKLNMSEDSPVANDGDDKRQQHSDDDKEDGVVVGYGAVPQTLLSFGVEAMGRPAEVVW